MSAETLRDRLIDEMRNAHDKEREHPAPLPWDIDNEHANAKTMAECIGNAVYPEVVEPLHSLDLDMLYDTEYPAAMVGKIRLFADMSKRILARMPDGAIRVVVDTPQNNGEELW
jgi:hypothetical protein